MGNGACEWESWTAAGVQDQLALVRLSSGQSTKPKKTRATLDIATLAFPNRGDTPFPFPRLTNNASISSVAHSNGDYKEQAC